MTKGAPLLVHCSLGVGCTGVFIVLDKLLKTLKLETSISVFDVVKDMKRQRMDMIQTQVNTCRLFLPPHSPFPQDASVEVLSSQD